MDTLRDGLDLGRNRKERHMLRRLWIWLHATRPIACHDLSSQRLAVVYQVRTKEIAALRQAGQANPTANQWWLDYTGHRGVKPHD